jgi:hypothetical protein
MSLRDFWINVRAAADLPGPVSTSDVGVLERPGRLADWWLNPGWVDGYSEADFDFLASEERQSLTGLVENFREVAAQVSPADSATREQVEQAWPLFQEIVARLKFDHYADADAYEIGKRIEQAIQSRRPEELVDLHFETGPDHSGDPAIWIWAILIDEADFARHTSRIRKLIEAAARAISPERWPYVRFRTASEQTQILEEVSPYEPAR